jgi:hypothetical protein
MDLKTCARCGVPYDWRKSLATLKMTYCNGLCERAGLGFSIEGFIRAERVPSVRGEQAHAR